MSVGLLCIGLTQLLLQKLGSHALQPRVARIGQVLDSNGGAISRIGIANRVALFSNVLVYCSGSVSAPAKKEKKKTYNVADVERLGNPVLGNAFALFVKETCCILRLVAALHIDIASKTRLVPGVANEEDALDSIKAGAGELAQSIDNHGRSLRVSLEDDALRCVLAKDFANLVDQLEPRISFEMLCSRTRTDLHPLFLVRCSGPKTPDKRHCAGQC